VTERLDDQGELHPRLMTARWRLVLSWGKDIKVGSKLINARGETILEKPSFRKAAVKRRMCLPARAPVIVPRDMLADWLVPRTTDPADVRQLLDAIPDPALTPRVVSDRSTASATTGPSSSRRPTLPDLIDGAPGHRRRTATFPWMTAAP